jgi:RNA polymerase sigma-70 factor, ECF subfamily
VSQTPHDLRRSAFERLVTPLYSALYRVARRLGGGDDEAPDLVQETCLRAFRTFDAFAPGTNAKAWLFTILYSIAINRGRRRRLEPETLPGDEIDRLFAAHIAGQPDGGSRQWTEAEVARAVDDLPEPFREAVLLVDLEELTYEEAAGALECPVGTLRSRLFRGRKLLAISLADYAARAGFDVTRGGRR